MTMHVQEFDSFEEAMAAMRKAEDAANASALEEQKAITYGDHWCRPVPEYGIFEFGRVATEEESYKDEEPETVAMLRDSHERGYRYGMAYSVLGPDGELGSTHVANMWPITEAEFLRAKEDGWQVTADLVEKVMQEHIAARIKQGKGSSVDEPAQMEVVDEEPLSDEGQEDEFGYRPVSHDE